MKRNPRSRALVDQVAAHELILFADSDGALYPQKNSIIENVKRRIARGDYDPAKAPRLWLYWIDAAARKYVKDFGSSTGRIDSLFNKPTRERAAKEIASREYAKILAGEYGPRATRRRNPARADEFRVWTKKPRGKWIYRSFEPTLAVAMKVAREWAGKGYRARVTVG
ncbi:MAG: hypothetical protein ACYDDA_03810 [Acidiferrobacteraceae bacterium]